MAIFAVEKRKIGSVKPHSNADRLELATVEGMTFQFCIKKGEFVPGDEVVYFPVDSVFPSDLAAYFGIQTILAGGVRVKTVKLRGEISQGFVASVDSVIRFLCDRAMIPFEGHPPLPAGEDLNHFLGVTKWEPPVVEISNARLIHKSTGYDIEGADRFPGVIEALMDKAVVVTEKVEGQNFHATLKADGTFMVGQRSCYIESFDPANPHIIERVGREQILPILKELIKDFSHPVTQVMIRGEFAGPQCEVGNYYELKQPRVFIFEVEVDEKPIPASWFNSARASVKRDFVPVLFQGILRDYLAGRTLQEASNGKSHLNSQKLREGIVIRPAEEMTLEVFGRAIIKQRSPEYLAKTNA